MPPPGRIRIAAGEAGARARRVYPWRDDMPSGRDVARRAWSRDRRSDQLGGSAFKYLFMCGIFRGMKRALAHRRRDHGHGDEGAQKPPSGGYEPEGGDTASRTTEPVSAVSWTRPGRGRGRTPAPAVGMCDGSFRTLQVDRW